MRNRTIGIITGIIALVSTGLSHVLNLGVGRLESATTPPSWMPFIESFGTTIVLVDITVDVLVAGVPLVLAIGFGYYLGHRIDVARGYFALVKAVGIGSTLGVLLGWGILLAQGFMSSSGSFGAVLLYGGSFLRLWINFAFVVALGIFAGATYAHFRMGDQPPIHPTEATADTRSKRDTDAETPELDSQSTR
jgi:hypothetical protein